MWPHAYKQKLDKDNNGDKNTWNKHEFAEINYFRLLSLNRFHSQSAQPSLHTKMREHVSSIKETKTGFSQGRRQ